MKCEYAGKQVKNLPNKLQEYVTARFVDGEYWFYGTYRSPEKAREVANEISGEMIYASGIKF